jgi:hypothetical protein
MRVFAAVLAAAGALFVAATAGEGAIYRAPRTSFGAPDLQGVWSNASMTRLERPSVAGALIVSDAEAALLERRLTEQVAKTQSSLPVGQYDNEWLEGVDHLARISGQARTSWVASPADGKLPYTAEGLVRSRAYKGSAYSMEGPETRSNSERCISGGMGSAGVPILNQVAAAHYQIVQTRDAVVIVSESNHDARVIRLNGGHLPPNVRVWIGDSIGHWEKDTLVVESTNFRPDETDHSQMILSPDARVTERFTRTSRTEIRYEFTVDDPADYSQVWRGEMPFVAAKGPVFEYACHEGNYSLPNVLAGARHEEAMARETGAR